MSLEVAAGTVIVRKDRLPRGWGFLYLVVGAGLIWYSVAQAEEVARTYFGVAFGLLVSGAGVACLLPGKELLRFDTASQLVQTVTYTWLGRRQLNTVPFADVSSIGTDTFKDPRNGAVWALETVLRLKDGRHLLAGAAAEVYRISELTGLLIEHRDVWQEEPPNPSASD